MSIRELETALGDGAPTPRMALVPEREASRKMHHLKCPRQSDAWQRAPASLLAGRGFRWAKCCAHLREQPETQES